MNEITMNPMNEMYQDAIDSGVGALAAAIDQNILEEAVPTFNPEGVDIYKLVREAYTSPNKTTRSWAQKMWYKLHNKPGEVKVAGDQKYFVGPNGNWIKAVASEQ